MCDILACMKKKPSSPLEKLTRTVERGFAAAAEDVAEIKRTMATKEDILRIEGRLLSIEQELKDIKHRLNALGRELDGVEKYAGDISELRSRIKVIERHLKIHS